MIIWSSGANEAKAVVMVCPPGLRRITARVRTVVPSDDHSVIALAASGPDSDRLSTPSAAGARHEFRARRFSPTAGRALSVLTVIC